MMAATRLPEIDLINSNLAGQKIEQILIGNADKGLQVRFFLFFIHKRCPAPNPCSSPPSRFPYCLNLEFRRPDPFSSASPTILPSPLPIFE